MCGHEGYGYSSLSACLSVSHMYIVMQLIGNQPAMERKEKSEKPAAEGLTPMQGVWLVSVGFSLFTFLSSRSISNKSHSIPPHLLLFNYL